MIRTVSIAAALALCAAPALAGEPGGSVFLTFETGVAAGQVRVALFDSEEAYVANRPVGQAVVDAGTVPAVALFRNLPAGEYAAKAFHDVDGDGRMKVNAFGVPLEPFAFSNNAQPNMGPASWDLARFVVAGEVSQTVRIR